MRVQASLPCTRSAGEIGTAPVSPAIPQRGAMSRFPALAPWCGAAGSRGSKPSPLLSLLLPL
jgi:hypothetical protein